ncbi:MAG TPA: serine hydrolase [Chitinophagaceae bacterium]|nr:serine hydrolase [Chitinophagaceae bacterium]
MNNLAMKFSVILSVIAISCTLRAQEKLKYSKAIEDKISKVENNLGGWVNIQDSINTWNLDERMKHYHIRGLSIAVVHNYAVEWARGYGVMDTLTQQPVTAQTLFQAGSISKSLNAVGVLRLVQDRKIDLYTDINQYLHSWKFPYDSLSKGKKITIANLLSHTAGLTVHGFPGYERGDTIPSIPEVLNGKPPANTAPIRSQFEPGLRFQYSGGGTTISQLIVMDVTRQPYDAYMWTNVLKPLGMTMSSYSQPPRADKQKFLATGYRADGQEVKGKYHVYPEQAAAGLWTNPADLSKYIIETQLCLLGKSQKVLSPQMTRLRLTPYIDSNAALGVFIEKKGNEKYFGHNGADEGFLSAYTGSFENGNGVVVMVNSDNGSILNEVVNSVAKVYGWKDYYKPVVKKVVSLPDSLLDAYVGNYFFDGDSITIRRQGSDMILTVGRVQQFKIYFTSPEDFFTKDMSLEFKFEKDAAGKVKDFYFKQGPQEMHVKRL